MDEAFYALVDAGEEIRSVSDAHRFLEKLAAHYDVQNLAYLGVNVPSPEENRPVFVISTYSKAWVDRYRARNYQRIDPVLPESMKGILPLDWRNLPPLRPAAARFFGEARDYGVHKQGLSIPSGAPRAIWPSSRSTPILQIPNGKNSSRETFASSC